ncbi:hypothetical protein ACHZ98_19035 [Streptomyces sp. MAR4 CNY-716]
MSQAPATTAFSRARGLRSRRGAAALGAVVLSAFALSACEKPTPVAQITVGSRTATTEAQCYDDGKNIPNEELETCVSERAEKSITVDSGDPVRIGVEPDIADNGWVLFVDGRLVTPTPSKHTYASYNADQFFNAQSQPGQVPVPSEKAKVGIVEIDDDGNYKGAWSFDLKRKQS